MADRKRNDGPSLFDLPLRPEEEPSQHEDVEERPLFEEDAAGLPAFEPEPPLPELSPDGAPVADPVPRDVVDDPAADAAPTARSDGVLPASLANRLWAALLDGGILLSATAVAVVGAYGLGVRWQLEDLAPLLAFDLVFSFVYAVVPLAFWGRTPGMALVRTSSRDADGGPLTFGQTALRWLGGLLTLALAGLPLLLALPALGGRSLADRLSGSRTLMQDEGLPG